MQFPPARLLALTSALLLGAPFVLGGCGGDDPVAPTSPRPPTVAAALEAEPRFSGIRAAFRAAALDGLLAGPVTLLAPDDEAFYNIGPESATALLAPEHRAVLVRVLRAHLIAGPVDPAALTDGQALVTLGGDTLRVRVEGGMTYIGTAAVVGGPIEAEAGRVLRVSDVLREHLTLAERLRLSPLLAEHMELLERTGLGEALADPSARQTVFASINDGYAWELQGTALLYAPANADLRVGTVNQHVIPGEALPLAALLAAGAVTPAGGYPLALRTERALPFVDGSRVLYPDVRARNGVLHVLDRPLLQHLTLRERLRLMAEMTSLLALFERAGHVGWLEEEDPQTLFAFTDEAFDDLGTRVAGALINGERPAMLERLLAYHLVPGRRFTSGFETGGVLPTRSGHTIGVQGALRVSGRGGGVDLAPAHDVVTRNGVLHVASGVLTPPYLIPDLLFFKNALDFVRLIESAGYDAFLREPGPFTIVAPSALGAILNPAYACVHEAGVRSHVAPGLHYIGETPLELPTLGPPGYTLFWRQAGTEVAYYAYNDLGETGIFTGDGVLTLQAENGLVYRAGQMLFPLPTTNPACP